MLESPAQEIGSTHPARSAELPGRFVAPCPESMPAHHATGANDTALRAAHSYGCSVPQLYNTVRPHSSLGYRPPAPAAWQIENNQGHGKVESQQRFPLFHTPDCDGITTKLAALH
jgi:hypothetical protein